jgi:hypothetical protein
MKSNGAFQIVDHERAIRWHPGRLYWAEVVADNSCTRKLIREIYRPYARPSAHIKNTLRVLCNGCTEEPPVKNEPEYVVFKI